MRLLFVVLLVCTALPFCTQRQEAEAAESDLCAALVAHRARPDVAFRPGVDVNGAPVVPADIDRSAVDLPEVIEFEITVDLGLYLGRAGGGRPGPPPPLQGEGFLGVVTLLPDGALFFNGRPLKGREETALRRFCSEQRAGR